MNDSSETHETETDDAHALSISALMDGDLSDAAAHAALAAATRPEGQDRWQLYHLIGDALRSPGLAARHDAALLANVRAAIGQEQALAPEPSPLPVAFRREAANDGVFRWKLVSGFASVVAVAAIGWNVWGLSGLPSGRQLAQARPVQSAGQALASQAAASAGARTDAAENADPLDAQRLALNASGGEARMLRDPQLDRLLAAHRGMAALGGSPSAFLRTATFEELGR